MHSPQGRWSISRAAVLITIVTAVSTLLGLVRDIVIAAVFGAGPALDAYLVAQGLMNIVLGLIAGAMSRSITPVVAREAGLEDGADSSAPHRHRSFDVAISVTMIVLGLAGVVMWLLVAPVTTVLAPGFDAERASTTQDLTRIVLLATVLIAGTNLLAAMAHGHGRFFWASIEGVPFNLIMIVTAAIFGPAFGVMSLAIGFVVGSAVRLLFQLPPIRAAGIRIVPSLDLRDPGFREIAKLVPALMVGSAIGNVNTLVDRAVGSTLAEGTITALSYGWRLVSLPETLLIASLLVPLYAALGASAKERSEVRRLVGRGLAATITVLTPVCVILVTASEAIVETVFGYGAFDLEDANATATAVFWYAPALLVLGLREVVLRASYAVGDATAPVIVALIAMVINVVGDLALAPVFGISGLAVATTLSISFAAVANGFILHRRHRGIDLRASGAVLLRAALIGLVGLLAGYFTNVATTDAGAPPFLIAAAASVVVVVTYSAGLVALRAPERGIVREIAAAIRRPRGR